MSFTGQWMKVNADSGVIMGSVIGDDGNEIEGSALIPHFSINQSQLADGLDIGDLKDGDPVIIEVRRAEA